MDIPVQALNPWEVLRVYYIRTASWDLLNLTGSIDWKRGRIPANAEEKFRSDRKAEVIKKRLRARYSVSTIDWRLASSQYLGSSYAAEDLNKCIQAFLKPRPELRPHVTGE